MRILHINGSDQGGGAEQFAYDFVHAGVFESSLLVQHKTSGSGKVLAFPKTGLDRLFIFLDKILYKAGVRKRFKQLFSISDQFNLTYRKLKNLRVYQDADLIHLHNIHGGYFDLSALRKIAVEKPIVWSMHDMWAITGGEAHTFGNKNYTLGIGKTPYGHVYPLKNPLLDRRQHDLEKKKKIYRDIASNTVWIPASYWLEKCVKESYVFNPAMRVQTIPYGINLAVFKNDEQRNWSVPRILFFNSESFFKGSEIFLEIISQIKNKFDLYVIGKKINFQLKYNITYLPYATDRQKLSAVFNSIDILVFPSKADTFPFTILEAMACGVCVVGSRVSGIAEQLEDSIGILFENKQAQDLLSKINFCTGHLEDTRNRGMNASLLAIKNYDALDMHKKYADVYRSLAGHY